jgi:putative glycosyltransferase (TIGR04372 family)
MFLSRAQIVRLLPPRAAQSLKVLRSIFAKCGSACQRIAFPIKYYFYAAVVSAVPQRRWGYEKILSLIFGHRSHDLITYSRLFLYYFQRYREAYPECILKWRVRVCTSHLMLQDTDNLQNVMQDFINTQDSIIRQKHLDVLGLRIINEDIFQYYNAHAYLDTHVKAMLLGWLPKRKLIQLIHPGDPVLNPVMLDYWKQYITVFDDEEVIRQLSPLRKYLESDVCMSATLRGKAIYIEHAKCVVQKEWEKQNRKPLFQLNADDQEYGREQLEKVGIPRDAWFVSLHVRDAGYKTGSYLADEAYDSYRNADIESYKLAIQEVVQRGGYVIRVGDPKMKPFAGMTGFFDYALSDVRSNRMDIFLFSQCRCFVGVSSGPVLTPVLFGVPVVMTNFVPMSGRPHAGNCLFIPKLLWLRGERRYATFHEVLSTNLGRMFTSHGYEQKKIDIIDNSPEDIRDVVAEMLDRLDGNAMYSEEDEKRQGSITDLYKKYSGYGDMGRMGKAFIQNYANQGLL